jgi:hypothetical protein
MVSAVAENQTNVTNQSSQGSATNTTISSSSSNAKLTNQNSATKTGKTEIKITISQLNNAASRVKNFYASKNRLPNTVKISTYQVTMPQFLQLLTEGLLQVSSGSKSPVILETVNAPKNPVGTFKSGNIYKSEYLSLAKTIKSSIDKTGTAPDYLNSSLGGIRYETLTLTYSKVMSFYGKNKKLPNYVAISGNQKTSTNLSSSQNSYSPYDVKVTSQTVQATAKCSCGAMGDYNYHTGIFKNYCPCCKKYGVLTFNPKGVAEGEWTCSHCDADYCAADGKEKIYSNPKYLTPA